MTDKEITAYKARLRREANPEKFREISRQYYQRNKAKIYARVRAWQKANPDKMRAHIKKWRDKNPEKFKATQRAYRLRVKAILDAYRASHA